MSDVSRHRYTIPRARGEGAQILYTALSRGQLSRKRNILRNSSCPARKDVQNNKEDKGNKINDPEGEVAVGLVFFTESKDKAILFKEALMAENIRTPSGSYPGVVYEPLRNDGHVFMHWGHLLPGIERVSNQYRQTLDLLSRAVHIDISPLDGEQEINDIIEGIRKVSSVVL